MAILIKLFLEFLKIGAFSYGGGYTALSLIEREIVHNNGWLTVQEFLDVLALAQITPGPVGINSATFVGFKIAGIPGSIVSTTGIVLVSFLLVVIIAHFYLKFKELKIIQSILLGLKPAIIGIIATVVYRLSGQTIHSIKEVAIVLLVVIGVIKMKVHPILAIFISAGLGFLLY